MEKDTKLILTDKSISSIADYIFKAKGGEGVIRELFDMLIEQK